MGGRSERFRGYEKAWARVASEYRKGYVVSERGLQATLYLALREELSGVHVVVEPQWEMEDGASRTPDLVLVEDDKIADVFEIKFVPHYRPEWRPDICKLLRYTATDTGKKRYPVHLDPDTGQWRESLQVQDDCLLHFVAVARHDAEAVWPLPSMMGWKSKIHHWYGRVGNGDGVWESNSRETNATVPKRSPVAVDTRRSREDERTE